MSVAAAPLAAPNTISPQRSRSMSPHSILRPCSSVVEPSKDAAGNRQFGWLAAPPKDLAAPRPSPVVVAELQPQAQIFTAPAHAVHGSPTSDAELSVPPLSPSVSQDSVADSQPSLPESLEPHDGDMTPRSSAASPCIRFGALPERPPELRRRNSITLGVLARKNMLTAQGTTGQGNVKRVMMTDDEWEEYQRQFAAKNQTNQAVDLGAVVKSGARNFFGKLRRGSNSSTTSTALNSSVAASSPARGRSDSAPGAAPVSANRVASSRDRVAIAPPVPEEPEEAGDETPRRGRSPSPMRHAPHSHHHFNRSPSPPRTVFHDEDTLNKHEHDERRPTDDASYERMRHYTSTEASLGFEMSNYASDGRPAFARSASGA
ncbi:hypothetical protein CC85DRAFT_283061 [Cutaneotrichosporon oleaginosum]|uniref:Uncharacterized protein n=1 Tax=Cutaneotrichosporon oleaginosum TaxID=879819 RepID=A0A0J0XVN7_9TREE|nr:uncharacterized protein CC85DRAFT_283061 [Cutaneotrichosporon oleaginosum]KLT45145.1 hypothetical protein CC85DRAFT_283061 [Cutaneotrichosporon oleaginosum]TXT09825.1 hypothetical protein COLE_03759 [Cutaneotrichosporon oleaginosum]